MEKNDIWKNAEQSFVSAYDFANDVLSEKVKISSLEQKRLCQLLKLWKSALADMSEHASDVEMAQDFQVYYDRMKCVLESFEDKFL